MKIISLENTNDTNQEKNKKKIFFLIPLLFIIGLLPLIMRAHIFENTLAQYTWFTIIHDPLADFYLFYKQWILVILGGIMLLTIILNACVDIKRLKFRKLFIPIIVYAVMSVISSASSKYSEYAKSGMYDSFENIFAVLAYCIIIYYAYTYISSESELKIVLKALIVGIILLSIIGISQILSHDLLDTDFMQRIYLGKDLYAKRDEITKQFANRQVTFTLFNPNYAGVYASMMVPFLTALLYLSKTKWKSALYGVLLVVMAACLVGTRSKTGLLVTVVSMILLAVFLRKELKKKWYFTIIGIVGGVGLFMAAVIPKSPFYCLDLKQVFANKETQAYPLEDIYGDEENIYVKYQGNTVKYQIFAEGTECYAIIASDEEGSAIQDLIRDDSGVYYTNDPRFVNIKVYPYVAQEKSLIIGVYVDDTIWNFSKQYADSSVYQFINDQGKPDEIRKEETAIFTNHETFATNRGYIWARTIPMLKDTLIKGVGVNLFGFSFPDNDYITRTQLGMRNECVTKPHSWYLQMGTESGVIALICMLIFYGIYFVSSCKIYFNNSFEHFSSCFGVAIFLATTAYMLMGFTNDSSITVAPVFWTLLGTGIAINFKFHKIVKED